MISVPHTILSSQLVDEGQSISNGKCRTFTCCAWNKHSGAPSATPIQAKSSAYIAPSRKVQKDLSTASSQLSKPAPNVKGSLQGAFRLSPNKGWIEFDSTVDNAEWLFDTEYHVYEYLLGISGRSIGALDCRTPTNE